MIAIVGGAGDAAVASTTAKPAGVASGVCAVYAGGTNVKRYQSLGGRLRNRCEAFFLHILAQPPERVCPSSCPYSRSDWKQLRSDPGPVGTGERGLSGVTSGPSEPCRTS
jgi:hypothetical protein